MLRRLLQALPPVQVLLPEPELPLVQVPVLPQEPVQVLPPLLPEPVLHPDLLLQLHMSFRLQ